MAGRPSGGSSAGKTWIVKSAPAAEGLGDGVGVGAAVGLAVAPPPPQAAATSAAAARAAIRVGVLTVRPSYLPR
jgi:hypothetical protein